MSIDVVWVDGRFVGYETSDTGNFRPFSTTETVGGEYEVDVSDVSEHLLTIPVWGHASPGDGANGATVRTAIIDQHRRRRPLRNDDGGTGTEGPRRALDGRFDLI